MGNCVCSCSFNHAGYSITYDEVLIKEKVILESPRKVGANFLGSVHAAGKPSDCKGARGGGGGGDGSSVSVSGRRNARGSGKLLLTPGFLHFWAIMSSHYFRLNLADATNVEFRAAFRRRRPMHAGRVIVVSFKDELGRASEVGFLVLPAHQTQWLEALRREVLSAGGAVPASAIQSLEVMMANFQEPRTTSI
mmetsp:Transcript_37478/g.92728  ORF Transcript_37478/g.92728 Transcript_37478/m.92728 type:complete len:193 (+) Transcript_37478:273-851(+)